MLLANQGTDPGVGITNIEDVVEEGTLKVEVELHLIVG